MPRPLLGESRLSTDLSTALQRDFFQFFRLRISQQVKTADGYTAQFAPTGEQFRERVSVTVQVDDYGRFQQLTLRIDRSVIDDEHTEPQARDIVKSFLNDATPIADLETINDWIIDIASRHEAGAGQVAKGDLSEDDLLALIKSRIDAGESVSVTLGPPSDRPQPGQVASAAFEVFSGERQACDAQLSASHVRVANVTTDGRRQLLVTIAALPAA